MEKEHDTRTKTLEDFLCNVSFYITWIGGFSVWAEDATDIQNNFYGCEKSLWQVPFILNSIAKKEKALIINEKLFESQMVEKKNISYGLYTVFHDNYLGFIKPYLKNNLISQQSFAYLEKNLLFDFFTNWLINYNINQDKFIYSNTEELQKAIFTEYRDKRYFKIFCLYYNSRLCKAKIMRSIRCIIRKQRRKG